MLAVAQVHVLTWQACYRVVMSDACLDRLPILEREVDWKRFLETLRRMLLASGVERQTVDFASFGTIRNIDEGQASVGDLYAILSWRTLAKGLQPSTMGVHAQKNEGRFDKVGPSVLRLAQCLRIFSPPEA